MYQSELVDFLSGRNYQYFITAATQRTLSLNSARRYAERITQNYANATKGNTELFWVAEPFKRNRQDYHLHGLLRSTYDDHDSDVHFIGGGEVVQQIDSWPLAVQAITQTAGRKEYSKDWQMNEYGEAYILGLQGGVRNRVERIKERGLSKSNKEMGRRNVAAYCCKYITKELSSLNWDIISAKPCYDWKN